MKTLIRLLLLTVSISLSSCGSGDSQKKESTNEKPILEVKTVLNMSVSELEKVLGKITKKEKVKGYPCENANCERVFFEKEKYEVIFKEGKIDRITINDTQNLSTDENAITKLGLPKTTPSFMNSGTVVRYSSIEGIYEINFNTNFIYIIVNPAK